MALAPKLEAINNSRTKPVIRDSRVNRETVEADLKSDTARVYALTPCFLKKPANPIHARTRTSYRIMEGFAATSADSSPGLKEFIMATKPKKKNPRLASGRKRVRQDIKLNAANTSLRSKYRTAVKNVEKAVLAGDKTKAAELFAKAQSIVDTVADKGIFHKNKAARDKSRLSTKVKALALAA